MRSNDSQDPFVLFHTPPPNETPEERTERESREVAARKVSERIDDDLRAEKARLKRERVVRVLLLGQSESGKSTTLKNFRLRYARAAWEAERLAWRSVVQLNVVRSLRSVLECVQHEVDGASSTETPAVEVGDAATPGLTHSSSARTLPAKNLTEEQAQALSDTYLKMCRQLDGLEEVQHTLMRRLGSGGDEDYGDGASRGVLGTPIATTPEPRIKSEWGVQHLQDALVRSAHPSPSPPPVAGVEGTSTSDSGHDTPSVWLAEHREAAKALWADDSVRTVLRRRRVRVEDSAGFFLDDLDRIARRNYTPSDADVVRARLRTLGVQEYRIHFDGHTGHGAIKNDMGQDWMLYDVGGSRTKRHAWAPYFDNIQAIIFLVPISCFDERLSEDAQVNRLEDSFLLFREICSSKLLAKATMVTFLNKCDLLKRKLRSGVQVKHYLPSFGSRANDVNTVVKYLREKFREALKEHSPEQRGNYFYATSVIDTEATGTTISAVRDSIFQNYLKRADFV